MKKSNVMTGVGIGMAVGGMAALAKGMMSSDTKRSMKKNMNKAMKSMESIAGDIGYMFK